MTHLRILNISGNIQIKELPIELSTCDSLVDLICDVDTINYPPTRILERGTLDILNYLLTNSADVLDIGQSDLHHNHHKDVPKIRKQCHASTEQNDGINKVDSDRYSKEKVIGG